MTRVALKIVCLLALTGWCSGLKNVRVSVPPAVLRGDTAVLLCLFDMEGDPLYSVKWYKGRWEFYRYAPREDPSKKIFPIHGLNVEMSKSNATHVTLSHVHLSLSGKYSCEVSADAPSFHTAIVTGEMDVVEVPRERPTISGIRHRYKPGDSVHVNCSSSWSKPAARLTWFINGEQAPPSAVVQYPLAVEPEVGRESPTLGLGLRVTSLHFPGGRLKLRCTASIHDVYWQSTEKSVEEDRPRWFASPAPGPFLDTDHPPPGFLGDLAPDDQEQQESSYAVKRSVLQQSSKCEIVNLPNCSPSPWKIFTVNVNTKQELAFSTK